MKDNTPHAYIIAEAGVNHNGDISRAMSMVDAAALAGADAVKFQTFKAEKVVATGTVKAAYQQNTTGDGEQLEMIRALELDMESHKQLAARCKEKDIDFLSSAFDLESVDALAAMGMNLFKIPSGEITNLPYLQKIGGLGCDILLSTGMSNLNEVKDALAILTQAGTPLSRMIVLQCNTEYPTPFEHANLRAMVTMRETLGVRTGYSDHTTGIAIPTAAAALGAVVIEKHFTLDRTLPGPDHVASLEPEELAAMVTAIRNVEAGLGSGEKTPSPSEAKNLHIARKYLVAAVPIAKGTPFSPQNLTAKRIGRQGTSPMHWEEIIGQTATRDYEPDEAIILHDTSEAKA